ncbi:MAG: CocE/NonD family hydrolase [Solirubrobacterales bacterium]
MAVVVLAATLAAVLATPAFAQSEYTVRGSVEQVYVTGLNPNEKTSLLDRKGRVAETRRANDLGALLFRRVKPGKGYRVSRPDGGESEPLTVLSKRSAPPDESIYDQEIEPDGYQYLETRDGTELAINVHPPSDAPTTLGVSPPLVPAGSPTPVLIEYSGYGYADPAGPESGISIVGNLMGFTVVDVNMRGTGCSGGSFDFFEPLQNLDGYDVIETIARQPWTQHGKVGMMGISYGGISQLFTAATQPPSLAAITPISLIDQVQTTLYPGGILNTGFAFEWAKDRAEDAKPAGPDTGQPWAHERIQQGDETCAANQALHGEAPDLLRKVKRNDTYRPKVADPISPITFVDKINVPTYMACQWQDEQTGGHCPTLASRLTGTDKKWITFTNGTHVDSLAPASANRWFDFMQLYVAKRNPATFSPVLQAGGPALYEEAFGISGVTIPPDPVQQQPTYEAALAEFEKLDPIQIDFDNGAGTEPGHPRAGFNRGFDAFPVPGTKGRTWDFSEDGALSDRRGTGDPDRFEWNPKARPADNHEGSTGSGDNGIWTAVPEYDWQQPPEGTAAAYVTEPLKEDTIVAGSGFVEVWVRASKRNVDLQATVTEVRPDDKETFVQGGWVRSSMRKLDPEKSTALAPVLSLRKRDMEPLPQGRFVKVTIPLYYQGHAYRAGSRIRVIISAPGGDQPIWAFAKAKPKGEAVVSIAHDKKRPSNLTLPVIPEGEIPTDLPPCPGLRAQPCRDYEPLTEG